MMDETTDFDVDEAITQYSPTEIDADDLLALRNDAEMVGAGDLAARIEIERGNVLTYEGYSAQFVQQELLDIGMLLMRAKEMHYRAGRESEVERIQGLAEQFLGGFDIDTEDVEIQVEDVDKLPTVDEVTDE